MNRTRLCIATITLLAFASILAAAPPGFDVTTTTPSNTPSYFGAGALTYSPNGTLYIVEARDFVNGPNQSTIRVINPDGTEGTPLAIAGIGGGTFQPGGAAFNPVTNSVIVTDNAPGANTIYSIDVVTGNQQTLLPANTFTFVDDVAVRSTGEIFVSDAPFFNLGTVSQIDPVAGTATEVVTGLDLAAGLDFDPSGNLIIQHATNASQSFNDPVNIADVFRLPIDDSGPSLMFGTLESVAIGINNAAFDLAVDADGDIFLTGGDFFQAAAGGLFQIDRDTSGNFLNSATLFEGPLLYSTEVDILWGADPFEPFSGPDGGVLSFVPDFSSQSVTNIAPTFINNNVPEPSSLAGALICLVAAIGGYRLARKSPRRVV